jgi:hypothetical protein
MNLYALCTPSHHRLRDEWFLPTVQDDFVLNLVNVNLNLEGSGTYREPDFMLAVRRKAVMLERAIEQNWGRSFLVCDVDIQFFSPVKEKLLSLQGDLDVLAQDDGPGGLCAGFYVMRANQRTKDLIQVLNQELQANPSASEQRTFNAAARVANVSTGKLPEGFFTNGKRCPKRWYPGIEIEIPDPIWMHHANWTVGVQNKVEQLRIVRKLVQSRISSEAKV